MSFKGLMISLFSNLEPGLLNESNQSALLNLSGSTKLGSCKMNQRSIYLPRLQTICPFVSLTTTEGSHLRTSCRLVRIRQTSTFLEVSRLEETHRSLAKPLELNSKEFSFLKKYCGFFTDFYLSLNFSVNFTWFGGFLEYFHTTCRRSKRRFLELTWTNSSLVE